MGRPATVVSVASSPGPLAEFDAFLAKLGARDRANIDRHLAACQAEPTQDLLSVHTVKVEPPRRTPIPPVRPAAAWYLAEPSQVLQQFFATCLAMRPVAEPILALPQIEVMLRCAPAALCTT